MSTNWCFLQLYTASTAFIVLMLGIVTAKSMACVTYDAMTTSATGDMCFHLTLPCQMAGRILAGTGSRGILLVLHNIGCRLSAIHLKMAD